MIIEKHFNDVIFDEQSLSDFGVHVSGDYVFSAPERVYETVEVPGRNGSLHMDGGRFKSITLRYPAFILGNFSANVSAFRNFMLSRVGAKRLEDSYHPDEFRKAVYKGPLDIEAILLQGSNFEIEFECSGERFLKDGEIERTFTEVGTIFNPTYFSARPLIRVYGTGTVEIGENSITITEHPYKYIDIDCALMDAYYDATNCNRYVSFAIPSGKNYVELNPGENGIGFDGDVTSVTIWPRWWTV